MPKCNLNFTYLTPLVVELPGERVPQRVGVHPPRDPSSARQAGQEGPNVPREESRPAPIGAIPLALWLISADALLPSRAY